MAVERSSLSEEITTWTLRDFSQGYVDAVGDNMLPDNATPDCQNVVCRKIGLLEKRPGQARLNAVALGGAVQGMHAYYSGTTRKLIAVAGGEAYYWNPGTQSFVSIKTGLSSVAQVCMETMVNYMVACNGVDAPWKYDGTAVSALANAPADGQFPIRFAEKLVVVPASDPSCLKWSADFEPENWPTGNYWYVSKGDGDRITCLRVHLGQLVVFKRRSVHVFLGTGLSDFKLDEVGRNAGCTGPFAAAALGPYLYFVSDYGPHVWNGMRAVNLLRGRVKTLWENVNKEHLDKAAVGVWDNLVWCAVPEGASSYNNLVLVYEPPDEGAVGGRWWVWRGINASCFAEFDDGTQINLYSGDSFAGYVNKQYVGTDDFGVPIDAYWVSKAFDLGSPKHNKKFLRVFVDDVYGANDADVQASLDYGSYFALVQEAGDSLERRFRFPPGSYGRYMRLKLLHNALGNFAARGVAVDFIPRLRPR